VHPILGQYSLPGPFEKQGAWTIKKIAPSIVAGKNTDRKESVKIFTAAR
jgi:hypothetical protein